MTPFDVPTIENDEYYAIQAVWRGDATEFQQRLAMKVIIHKLCLTDAMSFMLDSRDGTSFMSGREFVGKQLRNAIRWRPETNEHP